MHAAGPPPLMSHFHTLATAFAAFLFQAALSCSGALQYNNAFYSPRNKERPFRRATTLIVLHTTEAPAASAVRKLSDQGECNFFLDTDGRIYRIIDHRRVAYHAGRSMWNGRSEVDNFSIGIEVCGYHNRPITTAQTRSLAALIAEMKRVYGVQDYNVVPHSAVAYGAPNKWQRRNHRGRKRCGMLFMMSNIRLQLGLKSRPRRDPDVYAHRLVVGDPFLNEVLYNGRSAFSREDTKSVSVPVPDTRPLRVTLPALVTTPAPKKAPPPPPAVAARIKRAPVPSIGCREIGVEGNALALAGRLALSDKALYAFPNGHIYHGNQLTLSSILAAPPGTRVLIGYAIGGPIVPGHPASSFCGNRWNDSDTRFFIHGKWVAGDEVVSGEIPKGTYFFYRR